MSRCTKARCPMQFGTVPDDCDLKDCMYRTESNIRVEIIVNGNCMLCGKPLSGTRLFLCEGCSDMAARMEGADDED